MAAPDPHTTNILIENLASIVTGVIVILLAVLKFFPQKKGIADTAKAVITEQPVSHTELIQCKMEVTEIVRSELKEFNKTFMAEISKLHERINALK